MTDFTMSQFASKDDLIAAQAQHIKAIEAQLEAVGAGGVESLRKDQSDTTTTGWTTMVDANGGNEVSISTYRVHLDEDTEPYLLGHDAAGLELRFYLKFASHGGYARAKEAANASN